MNRASQAHGSLFCTVTRRIAVAVLWLLMLGGCAGLTSKDSLPPAFDPSLVSGERLFGAPLSDDETPLVGVLDVDADMRDFVAASIRPNTLATTRFHDLLQGMADQGLTGPDYDADRTLTAAETFCTRAANCLSYTNLFVALARQAGLDADYQVVDVPPEWDAQSGFLIRYTHINVLVRNVRLAEYYRNQVTVDFYEVHPAPYYRRRVVSDAYAESLYYANHAVALIRADDPRGAFAYLRRAIDMAPENEDLWINLGAVYAMQGEYDSSVEAYEVALQIDSDSRAAMSGLARSHGKAGRPELAEFYRQRGVWTPPGPVFRKPSASACTVKQNSTTSARWWATILTSRGFWPQLFGARSAGLNLPCWWLNYAAPGMTPQIEFLFRLSSVGRAADC